MIHKKKLDGHPSVAIVYCEEAEKILLLEYDDSYEHEDLRGSANLIGGNPNKNEEYPKNVLIREISEEFNPNHPEKHQFRGKVTWAGDQDIRLIRNHILGKIEPFYDFYIKEGKLHAIFSCFYVSVSEEIIECVERNINAEKDISSEGILKVFTLNQLENHHKKEFATAHGTAPIINYKFKSRILCPKNISCEPIGEVRKSFKDYLVDFKYKKRWFA